MGLFKKKKIDTVIYGTIQLYTANDLKNALVFAMQDYFKAGGKPLNKTGVIIIDERDKEWKECFTTFFSNLAYFSENNKTTKTYKRGK